MMEKMPPEDRSSDQIRLRAAEHLDKLEAQMRRDSAELSEPQEVLEEQRLAEGRRAAAAAQEAARRLAAALRDS